MRTFTQGMTTPFTMIGEGVFKVVESKDDDFPPGSTILAKIKGCRVLGFAGTDEK